MNGGHDLNAAMKEAEQAFARLRETVEGLIEEGVRELDVVEVAAAAGLDLDERGLARLKLPRVIICHRWVPWHVWFPWRPIWCWWWHRYYPWYRCCPWWWHGCTPRCGC